MTVMLEKFLCGVMIATLAMLAIAVIVFAVSIMEMFVKAVKKARKEIR